jgi:hypothetical protein
MPKQLSHLLRYIAGFLSSIIVLCFILGCNKKDMQFNNITENKTNTPFFKMLLLTILLSMKSLTRSRSKIRSAILLQNSLHLTDNRFGRKPLL